MSFVVYINYPTNKATVHSTDCHIYRNRQAQQTKNGHWTDHFSCLEDAQTHAANEGRQTNTCAFCLGEIAHEGNKLAPEMIISEETYTRVVEFKQVIEAVIEQEISFGSCMELILGQGIDSMLADLLASLDSDVLLQSFQQLGSQYPAQVYRYVAETLSQGTVVRAQEEMRQRLGFRQPEDPSDKAQ